MRRCPCLSLVDRGAALLAPTEINRNHYRIVRLAARYDNELDWYHQGFSTAVLAIAQTKDELLEIANERSANRLSAA